MRYAVAITTSEAAGLVVALREVRFSEVPVPAGRGCRELGCRTVCRGAGRWGSRVPVVAPPFHLRVGECSSWVCLAGRWLRYVGPGWSQCWVCERF